MNIQLLHTELLKHCIQFETGLTEYEIEAIEQLFRFHFPPDLKLFLKYGLPVSENEWKFPHWRETLHSDKAKNMLMERLNWPQEGIAFDIKNGFWLDQWGAAPEEISDRLAIFEEHFKTYPQLIPIYSHRYIPATPLENGNPIFSIMQTDIIYYGTDLINYFCNEFNLDKTLFNQLLETPKSIQFWGTLIELNNN
ncbi:hypothetical protein [Acinetobacter sp. NIPH 2100]|uniref:hypothetical protein n=1 Tax=Acinetobacter sp. NIPH 2100 TaxID=1217708 RepID=UPI0002D02D2D|nr:hypothetical protein [Acinetobacter sp. NIPH 2100]ENX42777.1 hypothetical protein F887_00946 [Acinetobacter sp. NIPH 2100]